LRPSAPVFAGGSQLANGRSESHSLAKKDEPASIDPST
jgi:hypothetical protein